DARARHAFRRPGRDRRLADRGQRHQPDLHPRAGRAVRPEYRRPAVRCDRGDVVDGKGGFLPRINADQRGWSGKDLSAGVWWQPAATIRWRYARRACLRSSAFIRVNRWPDALPPARRVNATAAPPPVIGDRQRLGATMVLSV